MNAPKNISASVKARLQNVAATRGEDFNLLLLRYGIERLLFRLSQSPHADRFMLKGAMLFVVWDEKTHRPTRARPPRIRLHGKSGLDPGIRSRGSRARGGRRNRIRPGVCAS